MYGVESKYSKKMIARIAEAQNTMCHAISRGNINQIGWNAWSSMVDLIQEMVLDHMNDAKTECNDCETDDLMPRLVRKWMNCGNTKWGNTPLKLSNKSGNSQLNSRTVNWNLTQKCTRIHSTVHKQFGAK